MVEIPFLAYSFFTETNNARYVYYKCTVHREQCVHCTVGNFLAWLLIAWSSNLQEIVKNLLLGLEQCSKFSPGGEEGDRDNRKGGGGERWTRGVRRGEGAR
jgi:hypothetical protein